MTQDEHLMLAMNINWEEGIYAVSPQILQDKWKNTFLLLEEIYCDN